MTVEYDDIDDDAMDALETVSDEFGVPVTQLIDTLPKVGVDPTEITEKQAERVVSAVESGDLDEYEEVLKDIGVEQPFRGEIIETVREKWAEIDDDPSDDPTTVTADERDDFVVDEDGEPLPDADGEDSNMSRREVQQMIRKETPSANEIVEKLQSRLSEQQPQQQDAGMTQQQQMALELAKNYLAPDPNPQMAEVEQAQQEMQHRLVENMAKKMAQPSLGERIGQGVEEALADEIVSNMEISIGGNDIDVSPPSDGEREAAADGGKKETDG